MDRIGHLDARADVGEDVGVVPDANRPVAGEDWIDAARERPDPAAEHAVNRVPSELGVRLQPGSEPIAGEVRLPDGSTRTFQGYVQLIAAVERAHHGAADAGPEPDRGEERHVG